MKKQITHFGIINKAGTLHNILCGTNGDVYFTTNPDEFNCKRCKAKVEKKIKQKLEPLRVRMTKMRN